MALIIKKIPVCEYQQNARILIDTDTKTSTLIDPGGNAEALIFHCETEKYELQNILLTHCHLDHAGGIKKVLRLIKEKKLKKPTLYWHSKDKPLAENIENVARNYGFSGYENAPEADIFLDEIKEIKWGNYILNCLFTPGHAPGHVAFYIEETHSMRLNPSEKEIQTTAPILISGDALFKGSIGRTDLPFGNFETLIKSIKTQFFPLPDHTLVLSGHGPDSILLDEKNHNPFLI